MSTQKPDSELKLEDFKNEFQNEKLEFFNLLGHKKTHNQLKIKPSLPEWMCDSQNFDCDIQSNSAPLEEFEIDGRLLDILKKNNITHLFPVQKIVVPHLIKSLKQIKYFPPRDVWALSPTGSGKTLAYAIPIVNHLLNRLVTRTRALILLPVSDLAQQVFKVFQMLCARSTLRIGLAIKKIQKLDDLTVDILVATPGKLIDLLQNEFSLKFLNILVIDEADRMMNETQFQWFKEIEYSIYQSNSKYPCHCSIKNDIPRQRYNINCLSCPCSMNEINNSLLKVLFSATFTNDPEKIASLDLYNPILFNNINILDQSSQPKQIIPDNLTELMVITEEKPLVLWYLIKNYQYRRIICFVDSILKAHHLSQMMKIMPDFIVIGFSSKQKLEKRARILKKFQNGQINMIISTDISARGIDISGIDCIICYDVPRNETAYIHRIGRTARAGHPGTAITLVSPKQLQHFTIISRRAHKTCQKKIDKLVIKNADLKRLKPEYEKAFECLKTSLTKENFKKLGLKKKLQTNLL